MNTKPIIYVIETRRRGKLYVKWHFDSIHTTLTAQEAGILAWNRHTRDTRYDFRAVPYQRIEPRS